MVANREGGDGSWRGRSEEEEEGDPACDRRNSRQEKRRSDDRSGKPREEDGRDGRRPA